MNDWRTYSMKYLLIAMLFIFNSFGESPDVVWLYTRKNRTEAYLSFVRAFEGRISLFTNRELKGKPVGSFSSRDLELANETICKLREEHLEEVKIAPYSMDFHRDGKSLFCDYNIHKGKLTSGQLRIYFTENKGDVYGFKSSLVKGEDTYYFRLPGEVKAITDSVESQVIYKGKRLAVIRPSAKDVFEKFVLKDKSIVSYIDRLKKVIKQKNSELIFKEMVRCISDNKVKESKLTTERDFLYQFFPTSTKRKEMPSAYPDGVNYTSFQDYLNKREGKILNLFKIDTKDLEVYLKFKASKVYNVDLRLGLIDGASLKIRKQDDSCIYLSFFSPWPFDDEVW